MLKGFPAYHYFKCGNVFTGAEGGMRYRIAYDGGGNAEGARAALRVTVWPGPWSYEHTAPEKLQTAAFPPEQAGLEQASDWLAQQYAEQRERWENIPSILDCEPDR